MSSYEERDESWKVRQKRSGLSFVRERKRKKKRRRLALLWHFAGVYKGAGCRYGMLVD